MGIEIRTIRDEELGRWCGGVALGFHSAAGEVDAEARRASIDFDRTWAAFDGDRVVATLRSFPSELTLPGGTQVSASAITAVTTTATHRRRGLASQMMRADLLAAKERGEMVAMLIAAEWPIYGRYGFGPATERQTWDINAAQATVAHPCPGTVEIVDVATARRLSPALFDQHRAERAGEIARSARMWDIEYGLLRYPSWPEPKKFFCAVAFSAAGEVIGLTRYEITEKWEHWTPQSSTYVHLMVTTDPRAESLLWNHLISMDHIVKVEAQLRPVDEILPWILVNSRHALVTERGDLLWIRPLNTGAFLRSRSYLSSGLVVLDVVDPQGLAGGRYRLEAGTDGASCEPTTDSPDITLGLTQLSAASLGGYRLRTLAAAGLVDEHRAGSLAVADQLFQTDRAPYCSTTF